MEELDLLRVDVDQFRELSTALAPPRWLRDLGRSSWYLVGFVALSVAVLWVLGRTSTIVMPVIAGLIVATVAMPVVTVLHRRMPRAAAVGIVLLGLVAVAALIAVLVIAGLVGQSDAIGVHAGEAADKVQSWLKSAGVDTSGSSSAKSSLEGDVPQIISTFTHGVATGIQGLTSLAFAISFTLFSIFFLLKDGPSMRTWVDRHLGVPLPVAQTITGDVITSVRRYFTGVTIVAAFNGIVVGLGALVLDVPLAGTIAVVTFVTAYVPFIGAFVAGAFAVVLALGAKGTSTALIMLVVVLLANGLLQNIVQPIAFGATLDLNPLVVLVVTIGAGSLFGMAGLVLAAPLTSAVVHITRDLARARAALRLVAESEELPGPMTAPT